MGFSSKGVSSKNSNAKIKLGEKCLVKLDKFEVDDKGNLYICVSNDSGSMRHMEYNIDPTDPKYVAKYAATEVERIKHVACCFIDEEDIDAIEAPNFKGWAEQLTLLLTPHFGGVFTLKIVKNKKNWPSLPMFTNFASSELSPCDWSTDEGYDIYEYSASPDSDKEADKDQVDSKSQEASDDDF
jgi:hypothetical protein